MNSLFFPSKTRNFNVVLSQPCRSQKFEPRKSLNKSSYFVGYDKVENIYKTQHFIIIIINNINP